MSRLRDTQQSTEEQEVSMTADKASDDLTKVREEIEAAKEHLEEVHTGFAKALASMIPPQGLDYDQVSDAFHGAAENGRTRECLERADRAADRIEQFLKTLADN